MVRLIRKDDLSGLKGHLSAHFRATNLAALHVSFITSLKTEEGRANAAVALNRLFQAAHKLCVRENEFNKRARNGVHTLFNHLRDASHFTAWREFKQAAANVMEANASIGRHIVPLVQKNIDADARRIIHPTSGSAPTF